MALPSHRDLTYFVEVAGTRNLSRAAERLGIRQPSLTQSMQRLEKAVGVPLLIRGKTGVDLTQAGKQFLTEARDLAESWGRARARALSSESDVTGSYVLGCHVSVAMGALARVLPQILRDNPGLHLRLAHDLSRKIGEAVIRMEVDLGIVVNPVRHPDLVILPAWKDVVTLWEATGCDRTTLICDTDLLQTRWVLGRLKKARIEYSRIIQTSSLEVAAELASSGVGRAILPACVAERRNDRKLKRIVGAPAFDDEICVVYRREARKTAAIRALAGAILSAKQSLK